LLHNQMNWPVNIYCIKSYIYFLIKNLYYYLFFFRIYVTINTYGEPGSSVSMVSGYTLDDRTIEVRSLVGAKDFSSNLCVQTGSGANPTSRTTSTRGPFPGGKERPGRDTDNSPPSSAEIDNE
jgi:hypothetical protein